MENLFKRIVGGAPSAEQIQVREKRQRTDEALNSLSILIKYPPTEEQMQRPNWEEADAAERLRFVDIILENGTPVDWVNAYNWGANEKQQKQVLNMLIEAGKDKTNKKLVKQVREAVGIMLYGPSGGGPLDNLSAEQEEELKKAARLD